jgi:hypothetical protein
LAIEDPIKYIDFSTRGSASIYHCLEGKPILQLGAQTYYVPNTARRPLEYFLVRVASTFGLDGWEIKEGRIDLRVSCDAGNAVVHDMFPRRFETQEESGVLELGLDGNLAWGPISLIPHAKYQTRMQRIRSSIESGGLLDKHAWWKFTTRKGESRISGTMETFLTIQTSPHTLVNVDMTLMCHGKGIPVGDVVSLRFLLNPDLIW